MWKTHHLYIFVHHFPRESMGKSMVCPTLFVPGPSSMDLLAQYSDSEGEVGMGLVGRRKNWQMCFFSRHILVGGDWNHGILTDFPETVGNGIIIPTDEVIFFRGVAKNNQPEYHIITTVSVKKRHHLVNLPTLVFQPLAASILIYWVIVGFMVDYISHTLW